MRSFSVYFDFFFFPMGKYTKMKNIDVFYKKDGKYFPIKKKSYAELNAAKKKKKMNWEKLNFMKLS